MLLANNAQILICCILIVSQFKKTISTIVRPTVLGRIRMDIGNWICALLSIFILFGSTSFSSSLALDSDEFSAIKCAIDRDCDKVCFQGEYLKSRCDVNGTCVCDCSDETVVTSSYSKPCEGKQPDGHWRDYCDTYCNREYLRPCRYCKNPNSEFYCTCVCVYPRPSILL